MQVQQIILEKLLTKSQMTITYGTNMVQLWQTICRQKML
jgi:hypothetical protein